jgi:xanthine dehydrogenase molybdenum-binding subunit
VVAHETGLDPEIMDVITASDRAVECGMTTASRATALGSAAAKFAAEKLASALETQTLEQLRDREFHGEYICDFTVAPGSDDPDPVTHLAFGYATQVVLLDEVGRIERVIAAHDVGRAVNPLQCAGQIEGSVHMGLGYALTEDFPCTAGVPHSLRLRDLGILSAASTPPVDVILIEVPDPVGGYGTKGVGEIGMVPTAAAVAGALHAFDGVRRTSLPMSDSPAAVGLVPKSRRT